MSEKCYSVFDLVHISDKYSLGGNGRYCFDCETPKLQLFKNPGKTQKLKKKTQKLKKKLKNSRKNSKTQGKNSRKKLKTQEKTQKLKKKTQGLGKL